MVFLLKACFVSQLIHNFDTVPKDNGELTVFTSILGIWIRLKWFCDNNGSWDEDVLQIGKDQ